MSIRAFVLVVIALLLGLVDSLPAAPPSSTSAEDILTSYDFDRALSATPAFEALGLSPETVTSPSTPRELATDLINGVDQNGILQHGVAIETAVFRLIGTHTSLREYQTSPGARYLYNFSLSIATSKAAEKSDAVQLAIGIKEVLYESPEHDPYRNPEIEAAATTLRNDVAGWKGDYNAPPPSFSEAHLQAYKNAVDDFSKHKWQGAIWTAALASTWNSESGKLSDLSGTGFTTWTAFAYGSPQNRSFQMGANDPVNMQFVAELRYRDAEHVIDPNDKTHVATQNTFLAAGRFRFGSDTFNGFAEGGYVRVWHGLNGDDDGWRGAVGLEKKLAPNVWLVLSAGQQFGGGTVAGNELFVLSSLRFGTADKAQFK